ncbi:spermidine synthase [uncultured archaeon]|nr:spermidine synthase [uncultured archaeon]
MENWFSERYSDNLQLSFRIKDQLLSVKTDFQRIDLFDTYDFGKLLTIDGTVQLTDRDEFVYHEMITMVPYYFTKKKPEKALIIGGGDGGAAKTLLGLGFKRIVNVEIDSQVVEVSKRFFPELSSAFDDPKVELIIGDGIKYAKTSDEKFDVVIIDSTDPVGPAEGLFNKEFYKGVKNLISDRGVVVSQSGSPFYQPNALKLAYSGMKEVFDDVRVYTAFIPTYPSGFWSFTMASSGTLSPRNEEVKSMQYFNGEVLEGSFKLPQFVRELLKKT